MQTISITYACKWRIKFAHNYCFTTCKKLINLKTGRVIKQIYNSRCIGYNINGKFYSLKIIRSEIELIKKEFTPF